MTDLFSLLAALVNLSDIQFKLRAKHRNYPKQVTKMRLDKFLKVSRILKRRTVAAEACNGGKIDVNGRPAKPGCQLKVGDLVCVHFAGGALTFRVKELKETTKKDEADSMYEIVTEQNA